MEQSIASRNKKISIEWENFKATKENDLIKLPNKDSKELLQYIRENIIGDNAIFSGPFGYRKITYCDYIASGRSLKFIEDYILKEVLPLYANTHTTTSITGLQTTLFRYEARQLISSSLHCSKKDILIFTGSGCTAAINKLVHMLDIKGKNDTRNPVIFIDAFNHHSNLLPWRESGAKIVNIKLNNLGTTDLKHLEEELKNHSSSQLKIGAFSAASNITGTLQDIDTITALLHKNGALAFWDYATAAPYVEIDMNPVIDGENRGLVYKDAIFFSPHKFIGGPDTPGILVAKKHLFINKVPENPGGGTVFFVTENEHRYLKKIYEREEGGTPLIVGSIRAGLCIQLKNAVGAENIHKLENQFIKKAFTEWKKNPNLVILGNTDIERVAIASFMVKHNKKYLHYNFVSVLLNDLFGIQCRGGCSCAGPYALHLLNISTELAMEFEKQLLVDDIHEYLRPGFCRLSFNYFFDDTTVQYIIDSVNWVANHGWKFLPFYTFNPETNEWHHYNNKKFTSRRWIHDISYENGKMEWRQAVNQHVTEKEFKKYLKEADELEKSLTEECTKKKFGLAQQELLFKDKDAEKLFWFTFPNEALAEIRGEKLIEKESPFHIIENIKEEKIDQNNDEKKEKIEKKSEENELSFIDNPLLNIESFEDQIPISKKASEKWPEVPEKEILTPIKRAMREYDMIKDGDRLLLGLSGGKDSLSLLHALHAIQKKINIKFEIGCVTVDPQTDAYDPKPLINYCKELGVPYFFESQGIIDGAKDCQATSICSWCSRMKRGIIYNTARREGYNVIVLGQHCDDLAESFVMSIFHNGYIRTQKANYVTDEGDLRVIRPMIYVRERVLKIFAYSNRLPVINENCPACFEIPKSRQRIKTLLASQEHLFPDLFNSLTTAMKPLMLKDLEIEGKTGKYKTSSKNKWTIEKALKGEKEKPQLRDLKQLTKEEKKEEKKIEIIEKKENKNEEKNEKKKEEKKEEKIEKVKQESVEQKIEHVKQEDNKEVKEEKKDEKSSISIVSIISYIIPMSLAFTLGYFMKK